MDSKSNFAVILVGAGRYGNGLVGNKYCEKKIGAELIGVVDPRIQEISLQPNYKLGETPKYKNSDELPDRFNTGKNSIVVDTAVTPDHIKEVFLDFVNKGFSKFILPKPVTYDQQTLDKMLKVINDKKIKTVVASNWHYSKVTTLTKAIIDKINKKQEMISPKIKKEFQQELASIENDLKIKKVEVEYNKANETLATPPPAQELPHALQILSSVGILDFNTQLPHLDKNKQSPSKVTVEYKGTDKIPEGVIVTSDLKKGAALQSIRERLVRIYLNDNDPDSDITVDYDALFDKNGKCLKPASITVDIDKGKHTYWHKTLIEDNLEVMYSQMFEVLKQKWEIFSQKSDILTLEKYKPLAEHVIKIHKTWKQCLKNTVVVE